MEPQGALGTQEQTWPCVLVACRHTYVWSTMWKTVHEAGTVTEILRKTGGGAQKRKGCGCLPRSHSDGISMLLTVSLPSACTLSELNPGLTITHLLACLC